MKPRNTREAFLMAYGKLQQPDVWTRGAYARTSRGLRADTNEKDAAQFCSIGAIQSVYGLRSNQFPDVVLNVAAVINAVLPRQFSEFAPYQNVIQYNDYYNNSRDDVLAMWEKAGKAAGFLDENGCPILEDPKKE